MSLFSKSFWADLAITYSAEIVVMGCTLAAPAMVSRAGSMEELGLYLLLRRVSSSLSAPLSLGLAVALARFLAMDNKSSALQVRWSLVGIALSTVFSTLFVILMVGLGATSARLLLGTENLHSYLWPFAFLIVANVVHPVIYGHYRGAMQQRIANVMQAINLGLIPLLPLFRLRVIGLMEAVRLTGELSLVVSGIFTLPLVWMFVRTRVPHAWLRPAVKEMMSYGIGRVPGFVFAGLLFTLGPIALAHRSTLTEVAMYALGLSFMRMVGAFFAPIGVLALPRISAALGGDHESGIKADLQLLLRTAILVALFAGLQGAMLSSSMLKVWLGSVPPSHREFFVPLLLVLPLYLAYEVLRNPIDALSKVPYNTIALGCSMAALVVCMWVRSVHSLMIGQVLSFAILGGASVVVLSRLYQLRLQVRTWGLPSLFCIAVMPMTWIMQRWFYARTIILGSYECVLFACFLLVLIWTGPRHKRSAEVPVTEYCDATAV